MRRLLKHFFRKHYDKRLSIQASPVLLKTRYLYQGFLKESTSRESLLVLRRKNSFSIYLYTSVYSPPLVDTYSTLEVLPMYLSLLMAYWSLCFKHAGINLV